MAAQFRSYVWDPALIVAQMVLLQAAYYSSLGLWLALLGALGSTRPSLHQVFSDEVRSGAVPSPRPLGGHRAPCGGPGPGGASWEPPEGIRSRRGCGRHRVPVGYPRQGCSRPGPSYGA